MIRSIIFCLISSLIIFSVNCEDTSDMPTGSLLVNLIMSQDKTILPDVEDMPSSFLISGTGPYDSTFEISTTTQTTDVPGLLFGNWNISVNALDSNNVILAKGEGSISIQAGETAALSLVLESPSGNGTLSITVNWDETLIENPVFESQLIPLQGEPIDIAFMVNEGTANYTNNTIPSGIYSLTIILLDNEVICGGAVEVVTIAKDHTTTGIFNLGVNPNNGSIDINITIELNDPIIVVMNGQTDSLPQSSSMTVVASAPDETINIVYIWYLNGLEKNIGPEYTFGNDLPQGIYRLDVTAYTVDGKKGGSATHTFIVQ